MSEAMSPAEEVVRSMCERYASTVNASDSVAYSKLFTKAAPIYCGICYYASWERALKRGGEDSLWATMHEEED